jgi:biotin operon repressor
LEELNEYVPEEHQIDEKKLWKESILTIAQAKKKYPLWYEKRVVKGEPKGTWTCKEDLYKWWLKKITNEASVGHRYFCVMCLAIYGIKSGVSKEQVKKDAIELMMIFNEMSFDDPFRMIDIYSALECYDERYMTFPINDISKISGITIEKNKRNGRKQEQHIKIMNAIREVTHPNGEWRGNTSKEKVIIEYLKDHPKESPTQIARALNVSRPTVYKYLKEGKNK